MRESKAELVTAALLAKGLDPTKEKEWAAAYRAHEKFSRETLEDICLAYRRAKAVRHDVAILGTDAQAGHPSL